MCYFFCCSALLVRETILIFTGSVPCGLVTFGDECIDTQLGSELRNFAFWGVTLYAAYFLVKEWHAKPVNWKMVRFPMHLNIIELLLSSLHFFCFAFGLGNASRRTTSFFSRQAAPATIASAPNGRKSDPSSECPLRAYRPFGCWQAYALLGEPPYSVDDLYCDGWHKSTKELKEIWRLLNTQRLSPSLGFNHFCLYLNWSFSRAEMTFLSISS